MTNKKNVPKRSSHDSTTMTKKYIIKIKTAFDMMALLILLVGVKSINNFNSFLKEN